VIDPVVGLLGSASFSVLFAHAAWHKWRDLPRFAATVAAYRALPEPLAAVAGYAIPAAEAGIAALLLTPPARTSAAVGGALLLLVYAGAIALNLSRGRRELDCGCAGPADRRPIAWWMVWRNAILAPLLLLTTLEWSRRPFAAADALTLVGGLAAAVLLYATVDRLVGQVMPRTAALRRGL